jgi:hypothetical protein
MMLAGVVLAVSACSTSVGSGPVESSGPSASSSPSPSSSSDVAGVDPSPSPSPDEADVQEQESIAAAKETVERYYDALAEQGNAGYPDWDLVLTPFWSGEVRTAESERYAHHADSGRTTTGRTEIVSMDVLEYTPSPNGAFDSVRLELCTDVSGVRAFEGGEELQRPDDAVLEFVSELLLQNQNGLGWTIDERESTGKEEC